MVLFTSNRDDSLLNLDLSIVYGLLTATGFGVADFIAKLSTDRIGFLRTALFMQLVGGLLLIPFTLPEFWLLFVEPWYALAGILLGVVNALATLSLYKGFEVGRLSVVSPIASSYPVVSVILAIVFLRENITDERLTGIALIMAGIILVGIQRSEREANKHVASGVIYAIGCMLLGGFLYFALKPVALALGVFLPTFLLRWTGVIVVGCILLAWRNNDARQSHNLALIFAIATFDTFANVIYNAGMNVGTVSIVSPLGGMFSAVTVLLASIFLKEKLARHQMLGFGAIIIGVTVLGYYVG
jgi:drug/metabolite transporter (DMT)-like permease